MTEIEVKGDVDQYIPYHRWQAKEGIPSLRGLLIEDMNTAELGPWDTDEARAGLHPTAVHFLADRGVAALGSDGNNDSAPSTTEGVAFPIHVLALNAMGVHLLDYLQLEDVVERCGTEGRWEFLFVGAPLRIAGGTGSPLNPIAIF